MSYVIVYVDVSDKKYFVSALEFFLIVSAYYSPKILRSARKININHSESSLNISFWKIFIITLSILLIIYIARYPGSFSPDSVNQYKQAVTENFNDHHPVLHTLFAFYLPLKLFNGWLGSIFLFQILFFAVSISYTFSVIIKYSAPKKFIILIYLYIILNPFTHSIITYPWKDVSFSITAMLAITFNAEIYLTRGEWLKNLFNAILYILIISACTIFRHNAILFTLPLFFILPYFVNKRFVILLFAAFLSVIFLIRYPVYEKLNVKFPTGRVVEITGLPLSIIGSAVVRNPEKLSNEVLNFAHRILSQDMWEKNFKFKDGYNSTKWRGANNKFIEQAGWQKVLNVMFKCFIQAPKASLMGLLGLTDLVFGILGPSEGAFSSGIIENDQGIEYHGIKILNRIMNFYNKLIIAFIKYPFWSIGFINLVILIFLLAKFTFKKFIFVLPLYMYNFGTMLLLTGNDIRFFYCSFLVMPIILFIILRDEEAIS